MGLETRLETKSRDSITVIEVSFVLLKQKEDCLQGAQVDSIRKMQLRPSDMVVSPRIVAREYSISR